MLTYCLLKQGIHSPTGHSILNGDGQVDDRDIRVLIEDILATRLGDTDFDGDGVVVFRDFVFLSNEFGFARENPLSAAANDAGFAGR